MAKQVSENKDGNVRDNFEVLTDIQQNAQRLINERLGLNFEKHWENYEIQLSEDNRVLEEINPNIRLNLGRWNRLFMNLVQTENKIHLKNCGYIRAIL